MQRLVLEKRQISEFPLFMGDSLPQDHLVISIFSHANRFCFSLQQVPGRQLLAAPLQQTQRDDGIDIEDN